MLGIRLAPEAEERLTRHAQAIGRGKSVVARDWILERLDRETIDEEMRIAAKLIAETTTPEELEYLSAAAEEWHRALDAEDGGYDWGPDGPPK